MHEDPVAYPEGLLGEFVPLLRFIEQIRPWGPETQMPTQIWWDGIRQRASLVGREKAAQRAQELANKKFSLLQVSGSLLADARQSRHVPGCNLVSLASIPLQGDRLVIGCHSRQLV